QPGGEEFVADIAPEGECRDGRSDKDGGDVVSRQPVEKRDSLRKKFGGGQGADRGAWRGHVFVLGSREELNHKFRSEERRVGKECRVQEGRGEGREEEYRGGGRV